MAISSEYAPQRSGIGDVTLTPLNSFSVARHIAVGFSGSGLVEGFEPVVIHAEVPVSRILSMPGTGFGCLSEYEMVVLGGPGRVFLEVRQP